MLLEPHEGIFIANRRPSNTERSVAGDFKFIDEEGNWVDIDEAFRLEDFEDLEACLVYLTMRGIEGFACLGSRFCNPETGQRIVFIAPLKRAEKFQSPHEIN